MLTSMCSGLEEILQKYHADVCALEQKALQMDPIMPVTKMKYILRDYYAVFKGIRLVPLYRCAHMCYYNRLVL